MGWAGLGWAGLGWASRLTSARLVGWVGLRRVRLKLKLGKGFQCFGWGPKAKETFWVRNGKLTGMVSQSLSNIDPQQ